MKFIVEIKIATVNGEERLKYLSDVTKDELIIMLNQLIEPGRIMVIRRTE